MEFFSILKAGVKQPFQTGKLIQLIFSVWLESRFNL